MPTRWRIRWSSGSCASIEEPLRYLGPAPCYSGGVDGFARGVLGSSRQRWFRTFASGLLVYLLFVIVFGAWVRITGSGAGCGEHWPTCNGEIIPRTPSQATLIEYTHRLTSGVLGVLSIALPVGAWLSFPAGHAVRRYALATLLLVVVEAAIGAGLVLGGLVASNASLLRAVAVALHLGNTLLLTASAALTALPPRELAGRRRESGRGHGALAGLLVLLFVVAASGAVTALGDTLFPVARGASGWRASASDHFLVQLRALHPLLAFFCLGFAGYQAAAWLRDESTRPFALALAVFASVQGLAGVANVLLAAPAWLQLTHLLLAQLMWMSTVLLTARVRV
jgi:cytochrome c oxidase assembly protein subunit 15